MPRRTASRVIGLWTRAMLDEVEPSWRTTLADVPLQDAPALRSADPYIAHEDMVTMWSRCTDRHGDPQFGIHFAEHHAGHAVGMFAHAAAHAPDLGTAARACVQLQRLIDTHADISMVTHDDGAITLRHAPPAGIQWPAHLAESLAASCVHLGRVFSGVHVTPREAAFQHSFDGRDVTRWFGCPVRYDQPFNALVFAPETLDLPFRHADPTQFAALVAAATRTLEAVAPPATIVDQARAALRARQGARTTVASLARALNLSERSLQRKLADAGVTFRELLDEVRIEALAEHTPKPQKLTAGALGYSDPSSVRRLRKRWRTKK